MRILMLSDFYPPVSGGAERYIKALAEGLVDRGHEVLVITMAEDGKPKQENEKGVEIFRVNGFFTSIPFLFAERNRRFHPPTADPSIINTIKNALKNYYPQIIHSHGWVTYSALHIKSAYRIPLVVTLHDHGFICPTKAFLSDGKVCGMPLTLRCIQCGRTNYGLLKSLASYSGVKLGKQRLHLVDRFIAPSSWVKGVHSVHLGISEDKFVVIPAFYNQEELDIHGESNVKLPEHFILFVGVLAPYKGVDVLLEAYRKLDTRIKLVLIGTRSPNYCYQSDEDVVVIENAPHDLVMQAWQKCRFGVVPSICADSFPTVALEAMACRKAIIASDVGGLRDIVVQGETGLLVPPADTAALSEAMKLILEDSTLSKEAGERAYQRFLSNYAASSVIPQVESVYLQLARDK